MGWRDLQTGLQQRREVIDDVCSELTGKSTGLPLYCHKGCQECCSLAVNCSYPEAASIAASLSAQAVTSLQKKLPVLLETSQQAENLKHFLKLFRTLVGGCPFLDNSSGCCTIYPLRPFSCRALLSTRNSSWCAVDFSELHPLERDAFLSSLDPGLVAFPTHYLASTRKLGLELETASLAEMENSSRITLSGNLIYQVWLERNYHLSKIIEQEGGQATVRYLNEKQLIRPYLLQLQSV